MARRKRPRDEYEDSDHTLASTNQFGMGQTLSRLKNPNIATFNLTDAPQEPSNEAPESSVEWQTVERRQSKKHKKIPKKDSGNYPSISHSPHARLQTTVKISDLQQLVLYVIADGPSPQWVSVRHHGAVRKVVVLMVPGLEAGMFDGSIALSNTQPGRNVDEDRTREEAGESQGKNATERNASEQIHVQQTNNNRLKLSPDDYYPVKLLPDKLPEPLIPLADVFPHIWPIKTPGDDKNSRMHSPLHAMLTAPLPKSKEEKKQKGPRPPREGKDWEDKHTSITKFLATVDDLREDEYTLHPAMFSSAEERAQDMERRRELKQSQQDGWVDTHVENLQEGDRQAEDVSIGSLTAGRTVVSMDCEMCKTSDTEFELTRISLVAWDGSVILDSLVRPTKPITDYLTPYSGITKSMLDPVTTTISDIQTRLLAILTPHTILAGHSLNADLTACKMTHPFIIDTTHRRLYPHPRGPPLKSSLKWLAQKYLSREIQKGHGSQGHDSIEDARAVLDLVKQKCEKGPSWGTSEASGESIFKRLARARKPAVLSNGAAEDEGRTGAVVDWGDPSRGHGASAKVCIPCCSDADVVEGVKRAVKGDDTGHLVPPGGVDFVWARLRELEAVRGWWNRTKTFDNAELLASITPSTTHQQSSSAAEAVAETNGTNVDSLTLAAAVSQTVRNIKDIYDALPPCTAFIVYSGTGNPREMSRLHAMQAQFKKEYTVKKWDQLSVKWTDVEEQALKKATAEARKGIGFMTVK